MIERTDFSGGQFLRVGKRYQEISLDLLKSEIITEHL